MRATAVWLIVAVAGVALFVTGVLLADRYEHRPTALSEPPPPGYIPADRLNEVLYLSASPKVLHRVACPHRTGREAQVLWKDAPRDAVECPDCMPPSRVVYQPDDRSLRAASVASEAGGGLLVVVGLTLAGVTYFRRPPRASFAPAFAPLVSPDRRE